MAPDDLIQLLSALEICYEDHHRGGYLIPAALDDIEERAARGLRPLQWCTIAGHRAYTYIGRRLQCGNQDLTVLTPGFFPRLQVVLRNYLVEQNIGEQGFDELEIDRNLLRFMHNTMDVVIEYGEGEQFRGTFVDVLVRTSLDHTRTVDFIEQHVLKVIRQFCAQPEGNQGVILVEGILRPKTVEHLVLCRYRENQAVLKSELERHLKDDISFQFCWDAVPDHENRPDIVGVREHEYAIDAVNGQGSHDRIRQDLTSNVQALTGIFEQLKDSLTRALRRLIGQQSWSNIPKLVYILEDVNASSLFKPRGEVRMRLHLMCERNGGPHVVTDQRGRSFAVKDEDGLSWMPLLQWTYKLLKLAGIAVARSVPYLGGLEVGIEMLPSQLAELPPAFFGQKTLEKIGKRERHDIIRYYERVLQASPCCEWLQKLLDLEGHPKCFRDDFMLQKVMYRATEEVAFLCQRCVVQGFEEEILRFP